MNDECLLCGAGMVVRTNRTTYERFLGCSGYPGCDGTRPMPDGEAEDDLPSAELRKRDRRRWERE